MAWQIMPIELNKSFKTSLKRMYNIPEDFVGSLIEQLVLEGKVKRYGLRMYTLSNDTLIETMARIRNTPDEFAHRDINNYRYMKSLPDAMRLFMQGRDKEAALQIPDTCNYSVFNPILLPLLVRNDTLKHFFNMMSQDFLENLCVLIYNQHLFNLEVPDNSLLNDAFFCNKALPLRFRKRMTGRFLFATHLMPGLTSGLEELCADLSPYSPWAMMAWAYILTHKGRYEEAIKMFQAAMKDADCKVMGNPLYQLAYIWALAKTGTTTARRKLMAVRKYKDLASSAEMTGPLLLAAHLLGEDITPLQYNGKRSRSFSSPIAAIAYIWVENQFHLREEPLQLDKTLENKLAASHCRLLQLELADIMPQFKRNAQALAKELGFGMLFPHQRQLSDWERYLQQLDDCANSCTSMQTKKPDNATTSEQRIIYILDGKMVTPKLQTSKDGITWTKGRNIALSRFTKGMPEMNDTDRRVASHVNIYNGWSGTEYDLSGAETIYELAGYPLVFASDNNQTPIAVIKEEPQLSVTKKRNGYKMDYNFSPRDISGNYVLINENSFRYRVMKLSTQQANMIKAIKPDLTLPKEAEPQLRTLLPKMAKMLTIHSDLIEGSETIAQTKADDTITALLQPLGEGIKAELLVKPFVNHPPYCTPGQGSATVMGTANDKQIQATRNLKKEQENLKQVHQWLSAMTGFDEGNDTFIFDDPYRSLDLLDILGRHMDKIRIEWPQGSKITLKGHADFDNLSLSVKGRGQWFDVEGELTLDTGLMIKMASLLEKVRHSKGRFIELDEGEFFSISDKLRRHLLAIDAQAVTQKGTVKMPALTASSLIATEQMGAILKKSKAFATLEQRIEQAETATYDIPKGLKASLRDYQADGYRWMCRLAEWGAGACLADDMGLGKTVQTIALLLNRAGQGPSLVVAPASVVTNWEAEIARFAPQLNVIAINATGCDRQQAIAEAAPFDVVITTYGLMINEQEALAQRQWNVIALDEAHTIKNKDTKMSKAAMTMQGLFRLLLTGTPLQNHLGEIWNLFCFATPGLLGSYSAFTERFITPIEKYKDKESQNRLKHILHPFILRRTKTEVLDELPEKTEITLKVQLSDEERAIYENLRRQAVTNLESGEASPIQTLAEITRLRQAACSAQLIDKALTSTSSKTEAFMQLTGNIIGGGHRALVFSQFTSHLALIRQELDKAGISYLYLDGSTPVAERKRLVDSFRTGQQPLFLISLKAGGLGLNLTSADYVIHLDPWWNPAIEDQASDRAYRIGQTRPVTIYRIIAEQTIEDKILRLHKDKKSLADSLLDGSDMAHTMTKDEMLNLLREL